MVTTLHHLVFCSTVQVELTDSELVDLLYKARAYNLRHHITGLLLYHASQFVAVLEGPAPAVRTLYERIQADARHHNVLLLSDGVAARRTFPEWHMGFVADRPEALQPLPASYFNPRNWPCLRHHAPTASPYLLNMLHEFVSTRPQEPVYKS
ncbi:BLUF domain-containing protein [uncultured Hymenobacter sp.]|uniref:BLUF domain-containing protein n=1 Tax=uncultured Hymenobacter sp. TaxID=170016 RepID=UPI0035CAB8BD